MKTFHPVCDLKTRTMQWVEHINGRFSPDSWTDESVPAWLIAGTFARYYATDHRNVTFG